MTRRAYLYFIVTFIIGIILGGAGVYYYAWSTGHWRRNWSEEKAIHRLTRDLNLTPQQAQQLRPIMDDSIKKWNSLQEQVRPQFEALHTETDNRIRQILTPDQTRRFDELLRARRQAAKGR
ncbi:MAG TPA: hypothetical protein VKW70_04520 [Terriglobia bacterium]|nr:hypothetical protein [Terriglobia bacterium]